MEAEELVLLCLYAWNTQHLIEGKAEFAQFLICGRYLRLVLHRHVKSRSSGQRRAFCIDFSSFHGRVDVFKDLLVLGRAEHIDSYT